MHSHCPELVEQQVKDISKRQQPGRPVPPLPGASVHQGSRWSLAFSSGVRDVCAGSSLFWFPRLVCLSEGLALPPTGFGCRELFIRSVSFRFRRCLRRRSPAAPVPSPTGAQRPYTVSSWARDVGRGEQCWWSLPLCSLRSAHLTRRLGLSLTGSGSRELLRAGIRGCGTSGKHRPCLLEKFCFRVPSSPGSFLAAENLVLPVVPRLRFARGVLPRGSLQRQQPGRPVPPLPGASVHQGSRWSLAFSSGVRDVCAGSSLFWFPRLVCLSESLALPPTGFGCRELFIRSVSFRFRRRCLRRRSPAAPGPSPTGAQRPYTVSSSARDVGRGGV
ncbi:uncharacterized protein LOC108350743 [Rattus norvegicus]|uniref:uncharacterized protein LOC108350743 n=1 Tax=Rattus norvegicus TaxID=10116 RepID=UPI002FD7D7EF